MVESKHDAAAELAASLTQLGLAPLTSAQKTRLDGLWDTAGGMFDDVDDVEQTLSFHDMSPYTRIVEFIRLADSLDGGGMKPPHTAVLAMHCRPIIS